MLDHFCAFRENFLTSQVTFSHFRSSFLSDLYCSHSEVKLVAKIKSIAAWQEEGAHSRVGIVSGQGAEVDDSNPDVVNSFCTHKEKLSEAAAALN